MIKKIYHVKSSDPINLVAFRKSLENEHLRFEMQQIGLRWCPICEIILELNISPDMVQEVEDLIIEVAEKSGVKVE